MADQIFTCQHCGDEFTRPVRRGAKPKYCTKEECRAKSRTVYVPLPEDEVERRRRQREEKERQETEQQREEAEREWALEAAQEAKRRRETLTHEDSEAQRKVARTAARDLFRHDTAHILRREIVASANLAAERWPQQRDDLADAIRELAGAKGSKQTYDSLLDIAAAAIGYAYRLRPGSEPYEREQVLEVA